MTPYKAGLTADTINSNTFRGYTCMSMYI